MAGQGGRKQQWGGGGGRPERLSFSIWWRNGGGGAVVRGIGGGGPGGGAEGRKGKFGAGGGGRLLGRPLRPVMCSLLAPPLERHGESKQGWETISGGGFRKGGRPSPGGPPNFSLRNFSGTPRKKGGKKGGLTRRDITDCAGQSLFGGGGPGSIFRAWRSRRVWWSGRGKKPGSAWGAGGAGPPGRGRRGPPGFPGGSAGPGDGGISGGVTFARERGGHPPERVGGAPWKREKTLKTQDWGGGPKDPHFFFWTRGAPRTSGGNPLVGANHCKNYYRAPILCCPDGMMGGVGECAANSGISPNTGGATRGGAFYFGKPQLKSVGRGWLGLTHGPGPRRGPHGGRQGGGGGGEPTQNAYGVFSKGFANTADFGPADALLFFRGGLTTLGHMLIIHPAGGPSGGAEQSPGPHNFIVWGGENTPPGAFNGGLPGHRGEGRRKRGLGLWVGRGGHQKNSGFRGL